MAETNSKGKSEEKEEQLGIQLFTLAYNPVTTTITYQTGLPLPKVVELVQTIMLGQQRELARREVLAEIAEKESKEPKSKEK